MVKKILLAIMIAFYLFAGVNHFINPHFYDAVIPPYLSDWSAFINIASGCLEIALALLLIPIKTRRLASWGIIIMLIAFIPAHIYFIQKGSFLLGGLVVTPLIAWVRLLVIHPILILWAWWAGQSMHSLIPAPAPKD
jgi:uncharacterized membrane protein